MSSFDLRDKILDRLPITEEQLDVLILRSPHTYKKFTIPKKSGGMRSIAQPKRATKYLQRVLLDIVISELPIHECVTAYQKGSSIKKNAEVHAENSYLSKFDFKDFFTSIKSDDVAKHVTKYSNYVFSDQEIEDISRIVCIKSEGRDSLHLSIGAPSSPVISNTVLYDFDSAVNEWCTGLGIAYTRYADDLTFSTSTIGITSTIEPFLREVVRGLDYPTLKFNNKKTIHLSKKFQRKVTGLVLSNDGEVSLGRSKKRLIRSMIHRFSLGNLSNTEIGYLQGILGLAKDVEPAFVTRMSDKYGNDIILELFSFRK